MIGKFQENLNFVSIESMNLSEKGFQFFKILMTNFFQMIYKIN